jgi:hypothetical protein
MGGGSWDPGAYRAAAANRVSKGVDDFDYDKKVKSGKASGVNANLDPTKVAGSTSPLAGQNVRESRDSDEHPESVPVAVFFDVTGSMYSIPLTLQKKLANLMDVIIAKAGLKDSQILVGAIGDANTDRYPFQVGQFESDNRFDEALRSIILEGNGGGQAHESYGLAYRFAAYHTATDAWEKRGKKGYLFTMGDEMPWPTISRDEVRRIFGVEADADETIQDLLAKAQEKWDVYHICLTNETMYGSDPRVHAKWSELLAERFIKLDDADLVCEVIAGLIHMLETARDLDSVITDIGLKGSAGASVKNALVPVSQGRVPSHVAKGSVPSKRGKGASGVSRI